MKSVFTRIIEGELPSEKVLENDTIIAFKDVNPKAPFHVLIVTKKPIPDLQSVGQHDLHLIGEIVQAAQEIARKYELESYRLVTNNGTGVGQSVFHLHFHLLAGKKMDDL